MKNTGRPDRSGHNDDGSHWTRNWDTLNANPWLNYETSYDAAWLILAESGVYDGGDTWANTYIGGALLTQTVTDADNSSPLASTTNTFDPAGHVLRQRMVNDDHSASESEFDVADTQGWETRTVVTDTLGRVDWTRTIEDDGLVETTDEDQAGTQTWATQTTTATATGAVVTLDTHNDDGTRRLTTNDTSNSSDMASQTVFTDGSGKVTNVNSVSDDGITNSLTWTTEGRLILAQSGMNEPNATVEQPGGNVADLVRYQDFSSVPFYSGVPVTDQAAYNYFYALYAQSRGADSIGNSVTHGVAFHLYQSVSSTRFSTFDSAAQALLLNPAPGDPAQYANGVQNGQIATVPFLGTVTHYVNPSTGTVFNVTNPDHVLSPGFVMRQVVKGPDGTYAILSTGTGTGLPGGIGNAFIGPLFWRWYGP